MKIEPNLLPAEVIQFYLDQGWEYSKIANFHCSAKVTKEGDVFRVKTPTETKNWHLLNGKWLA